jgi:hypothetical protein
MKRLTHVILMAVTMTMTLIVPTPSLAKTHKEAYSVPCNVLWLAVKDTLRNSGKYGIMGLENTEMTATYSLGTGSLGQKRVNSVALNVKGDNSCEMQTQSAFSGFTNDDAGDFKKRVDKSLAKVQPPAPAQPSAPEKPDASAK